MPTPGGASLLAPLVAIVKVNVHRGFYWNRGGWEMPALLALLAAILAVTAAGRAARAAHSTVLWAHTTSSTNCS